MHRKIEIIMSQPILVYSDISTGRVIRTTEFLNVICPAELPGVTWNIFLSNIIPTGVRENAWKWEVKINRTFHQLSVDIDEQTEKLYRDTNAKADCLEQLSRVVNNIRFTNSTNLIGWTGVIDFYKKDIAIYRESGVVSLLLESLAGDTANMEAAIAELQIKIENYNSILLNTEIFFNRWRLEILKSSSPYQTLGEMRGTLSSVN